jgi:hypothetical protein
MKIRDFVHVTPYSLEEMYRSSEEIYYYHINEQRNRGLPKHSGKFKPLHKTVGFTVTTVRM